MTWYEWTLHLDGYLIEKDERRWELGVMMAHIANAMAPKKTGQWKREDFIKLSTDAIVSERKLTFKEAKQHLGSMFKLKKNGE